VPETEAEPEVKSEAEPEVKPKAEPEVKPKAEPEVKPEVEPEIKPGSSERTFVSQYDIMSKERYVDSVSRKTDFDKVLDELASISQDRLSWDVLRMTKKHFGDTEEEKNRKLEAFLGAFIVNAATELFDRGLEAVAFSKLEQTKTILETKRKLAREAASIRAKFEETSFDVSDMLGLFENSTE
jgi:hypothetical protein